jgi:hypothetical protein
MPTGSGGAGGEVDGEDEYEDVSSDEQNAYDVLRTWQQVGAAGTAPMHDDACMRVRQTRARASCVVLHQRQACHAVACLLL